MKAFVKKAKEKAAREIIGGDFTHQGMFLKVDEKDLPEEDKRILATGRSKACLG